ncbi:MULTISPECIES: S9 family peptidase [Rhodomicrobium]|uniref:S9 family peptidase n=1 Tax=Rhodomicrobium TaxID=1068 RepID=UPI000B4AB350|nr:MULTISPECIES: S9 family peptidase [Rhodomicrobium]
MSDTQKTQRPLAPTAEKRPLRSLHHGIERFDDYAWLRADNWQEVMRDPSVLAEDIRSYLSAENAYTESVLAQTEALLETLFQEMKGRIKEDDSTVPARDGPWAYFVSFVTGGQHPLFCREPEGGGEKQVLLDGNKLAEGQAYFDIASATHSHDHRLLAYGVDDRGSEFYTLKLRDLDKGADLADVIPETTGQGVWSADGQWLFYTRLDENHRPRQVYRHRLGTPAEEDILVYDEPDTGFYVSVSETSDRRYILLQSGDHQTSEVHLLDSANVDAEPILVSGREQDHEYSVDHRDDRLIILTNSGGAEDFRIVEGVPGASRESWRELEPHRPGRLILDVLVFRDFLVRLEREQGLPRLVIRRFEDGQEHSIAFDEEAYSLSAMSGYEFATNNLRFSYSSMTTPSQIFDYDMATRERRLRKTQEVPTGHRPQDYITARVFAPAEDGELVPVSLLYRRDTPLDGSAPLLLYGYGSYGMAMPASFSTNRLSLVDRGFIYAIAHIRGGKDKGYGWYRTGRRNLKVNTFTDFIAAGRYLASNGFTKPGNIVAHGGSAGGMLMGAVANMAPELFKGVIAEVPFVDVLTTMLDASLPLTPPEWPEWGNPLASSVDYLTIAAYSPYDNVSAQNYPHILALAGLTDPRVTYWEPAKWVAKLRALKTDGNLLLLRTNMEAGHGGASGRFDRLKEVALSYAFALMIAGRAGQLEGTANGEASAAQTGA